MPLKADRIIVDPIHGAIELTEIERRVVDTATFQRLRHIKQLGLGHVTYPNATHTRFAHSLGVLAIMTRVLQVAKDALKLGDDVEQNLRLAALLHDIGHYPYSHLMERFADVTLTENRVGPRRSSKTTIPLEAASPYPDHEELGQVIVTRQDDVVQAAGGIERARRIADLFTRSETADPQLSKLLHSSLDMDRLDYLPRDARATGVPYGEIDVNYLLNNVRVSPTGMIGIDWTALPAADHFLFARYFMHRTVYYHKTTFGMEEAFRHLLRRCQMSGRYDLPAHGDAVRELVTDSARLVEFTDHFADAVVRRALTDEDDVIKHLAEVVVHRRPPKLLREEVALVDVTDESQKKHNACSNLVRACEERLSTLADEHHLRVGRFIIAQPGPVQLEKRGAVIRASEAADQPAEKEDELIKVFPRNQEEPRSLVDIPESLVKHSAHRVAHIARLYVVEDDRARVEALRQAVQGW